MVSVVRLNIKVLVERGRLVVSSTSIFVFCDGALTSLYLDCMYQGWWQLSMRVLDACAECNYADCHSFWASKISLLCCASLWWVLLGRTSRYLSACAQGWWQLSMKALDACAECCYAGHHSFWVSQNIAIMLSVIRLNVAAPVGRGGLVGGSANFFVFCNRALTSLYLDCMCPGPAL
jgi:hypothetical protein